MNTVLKTYQGLIISGAILLFCAVGFIAAVYPAIGKVQSLWADTTKLSDEVTSLQTKLTALNALDETTLRQELTNVISAVPTDKSLPTMFSTVDGLAAQTNVSVMSMGIGGNTSLASGSAAKLTPQDKLIGAQTVPFSVTIQGTLPAIQQFIARAPQVRRLLRIRTFSITFPQDNRPISIALEMDAFYQPSPTSLGKTGTTVEILTDAEQEIITKVSQLPMATGGTDMGLPPPFIGQLKFNPYSP